MTTQSLTSSQIHILQHTVGISQRNPTPYRNHFVAEQGNADMPDLEILLELGLMIGGLRPNFSAPNGRYFHASEEGIRVAQAYLK